MPIDSLINTSAGIPDSIRVEHALEPAVHPDSAQTVDPTIRQPEAELLVGQKKAVAMAVRNISGRRRWSKLAERLRSERSRDQAYSETR
jgi:hypothetical protein